MLPLPAVRTVLCGIRFEVILLPTAEGFFTLADMGVLLLCLTNASAAYTCTQYKLQFFYY